MLDIKKSNFNFNIDWSQVLCITDHLRILKNVMSSSALKDVTIRRATLDDKPAVLAINENVAAGRDYLPTFYDRYITSPNYLWSVLLYKDKIVR